MHTRIYNKEGQLLEEIGTAAHTSGLTCARDVNGVPISEAGRIAQAKFDRAVELTAEPDPQAEATATRISEIKRAIAQLEPGDYTATGRPKQRPIELILGYAITAAERDLAFAQVNQEG